MLKSGVLALSLLATGVMAAVSPDEAAKLGTTLTPVGGEMAGNADGSIPAWTGGLKTDAAPVDANGFLGNPYAGDKPLFVITKANVDQYKSKLSPGQLAMFQRYPDTYRIPVYPSRRSFSLPKDVYERAKVSALNTVTVNDGDGLANFEKSRNYAFPIPKNGVEVLWNHLTRYKGTNLSRIVAQAVPQTNGDFTMVQFEETAAFPDQLPDVDPAAAANILFYIKQVTVAPARLAGGVLLLHETLDQVKEPRMAWAYNAGQRRVRRAPQIAYDGPANAADGMRVSDDNDMFSGSPDRYNWKLVGKREMYIPYNNYSLWSPKVNYADIIKPGHINPDLTRYELHRVWEIEGTVKPGERHIYSKRTLFLDEDTWGIAETAQYDGRGQLWRVGEGFQAHNYQQGMPHYAAQTLYDLIAGRYFVGGLINESKHAVLWNQKFSMKTDFTPAALRNAGIR